MSEQLGAQKHIAWGYYAGAWGYYETGTWGYYEIWPVTHAGEGVLDGAIELDAPQTPENDARVKQIVALIQEMC